MKSKQRQCRLGNKMFNMIKKVQKENKKRTGKTCPFYKASNLLAERYRKR